MPYREVQWWHVWRVQQWCGGGMEILFCGTSWSCFAHDPVESSDGARVMLCKMSGEMRSQGGVIHLWGVLMWWIIPVRNSCKCFRVNSVSFWLPTVSEGFLTTTLHFPVVLYLFFHMLPCMPGTLECLTSSCSSLKPCSQTNLRWWAEVVELEIRKAVLAKALCHSALGCRLFEVRVAFYEVHNSFDHSKTTKVWSCVLLSF